MAEEKTEVSQAREEKYGHTGRVTKNDPVCVENDAVFAGKLIGVYTRQRQKDTTTMFNITCGHPGMKRDAEGRFKRDIITVEFDGAEGEYYAGRFHQGDFVIAHAVAQTLTNVRSGRRSTIFIGQSIEAGKKNVLSKDINEVHLTGRVVSTEQESDTWVSLLLSTRIWKSRYNYLTGKNDAEDLYRSITKIRAFTGAGNAKRVAEQVLTKGTIVTVDGRVYGRREIDAETGVRRRVTTIVANNINVVGDIQPAEVSPIETVFHKENMGAAPEEAPELDKKD